MFNFLKGLLVLFFLQCFSLSNAHAENKISIFVSILPQQYFVRQIGNDLVDVHVMVGPGQNPATYEPTPQQMAALYKADVYFRIGVPFESAWIDKIKLNNKNLIIVGCCELISDLQTEGHSHDINHDPHVWTSPKNVIKIAELIKTYLIKVDEKNIDTYIAMEKKFKEKILELDKNIKDKIRNLKDRILIVSHPSWGHFSHEYGFTQVSMEQEGKEIQARSLVKLIKMAKHNNVEAIFVQPQFNDRAAKVIANELNAEIIVLDPLALNYIENMNIVTDSIVKGLARE